MNCPRCDDQTLRVLESRSAESGDAIRRRRECLACGYRFTTYERLERQPLMVVKDSGREQAFDREKLLYGLVRACSKRNVPTERLEALVIDIEAQVRARNVRKVASREVGNLALQGLLRIDEVASLRFASVYRQFQSIDEFSREMQRIMRQRSVEQDAAGQAATQAPRRGVSRQGSSAAMQAVTG